MAPPLSSLYGVSFALALLATLFVAGSLRLLAILPYARPRKTRWQQRPMRAHLLVVLGSGGHTHEMLALLRDLDTRKYTRRTYVVSSGDAFSAQRAVAFEKALEERAARGPTEAEGARAQARPRVPQILLNGQTDITGEEQRPHCVGPAHYTLATIPRARRIHQPLYSTPWTALQTLFAAFPPLLAAPAAGKNTGPALPTLIVTNGPATAVIVVLAAFLVRFFNVRGAESRGLCRTVYVESFARVKTLSLSGKLLVRVVDRFLVQWEELEGYGGRAEFWGMLV